MMLGANLRVAAAVEPGQAERRVWMPGSGGWVDWRSGRYLQGGRYETLAAPLDGPLPLLAREGCAIPMNFGTLRFSPSRAKAGALRFRSAWSCGSPARMRVRWASRARCWRMRPQMATGGA